jgi:hypothetical protein
MSLRRRRLLGAAVTVAVLAAAVAATRREAVPEHSFRVVLGALDTEPTDWSGQVAVNGGEVTALAGWRFEDKDAVQGTSGWKCRTRDDIAPGRRYPIDGPTGKPKGKAVKAPWPSGVDLTVRGASPTLTLTFTQGEVRFTPADVHLGEAKTFLGGRVRVERLPAVSVPRPAAAGKTEGARQDDYPALWVRPGTPKQYLAWVAYHRGADRVLLAERDGPAGPWSRPITVDGPGRHFRVALAGTLDGTLWVVWSRQHDHNWDLYGRPCKDGKLGGEVRLTEAPGPDLWHRMTTDGRGRAWLVWQGFRGGRSAVFARCADGDGWHEPVRVSTSKGNDWDPCVAADPRADRVWVGWDGYDRERATYAVRVRGLSGGPKPQLGEVLAPEESPLFGAHVSLACDRVGRLWAAWDVSGPQWGKDTGYLYGGGGRTDTTRLYASRDVRIKVLADGKWLEPAADWHAMLPEGMREYNELPQLQADEEGRMWLAFRHRTCRHPRADGWAVQGRWDSYATACLGDRWLSPVPLPQSGGRLDMRLASGHDGDGGVYFAHATDHRGWVPPAMLPGNHNVAVSRLAGAARPRTGAMRFVERVREFPALRRVHPREAEQLARVRGYRVEAGGKVYRVYRGDLHRHTDLSVDGIGDGSLMDLHRYALDAAALDFVLVGDHNMGQDNEYCWWQTQEANDLYTVPGAFLSLYGYERSVPYPAGHRNVIWAERGHRTLPLPKPVPAAIRGDLPKLYAYLRRTGGICTGHTSATSQGTDWQSAHDPDLEPLVELFQGYHTSYEEAGAPKAISAESDQIHGQFEPDGFVVKALGKGYRLGFQASSDHISTHVSYACVLAEDFSRRGLVEAMRRRHGYAATDNIVLDVRMGAHVQGDEVRTAAPRLEVVVLGTGPIDRAEVLRDGEVVRTERPAGKAAELRFTWRDPAPPRGERPSYYYVRVLQQDGQMAWGSPFWVTAKD